QTEERGGARDRAEVMRVAHPIEDEERLPVARPLCRGLGVERMDGLRSRDRNDTAVQQRAGDTIELIAADQTEWLVDARERGAERAHARWRAFLEEQTLDPLRRRLEERGDRRQAGDAGDLFLGRAQRRGAMFGALHRSPHSLIQVSSCLLWCRCRSRDAGTA